VVDGLMQAVAVRAAGFSIVPLAALAPGVKYYPIFNPIFDKSLTTFPGFSM